MCLHAAADGVAAQWEGPSAFSSGGPHALREYADRTQGASHLQQRAPLTASVRLHTEAIDPQELSKGHKEEARGPHHEYGAPHEEYRGPHKEAGVPQEGSGGPQELAGDPQEEYGGPQEVAGGPQEEAGSPQPTQQGPLSPSEDLGLLT